MTSQLKGLAAVARAAATTWRTQRARIQNNLTPARPADWAAQPLEQRVMLSGMQELNTLGINAFRADPRFVGINGAGQDIVVLDNSFDVAHKQFSTGGVSRIAYAHDFSNDDADVLNVKETHGTHVSSIAAGTTVG